MKKSSRKGMQQNKMLVNISGCLTEQINYFATFKEKDYSEGLQSTEDCKQN